MATGKSFGMTKEVVKMSEKRSEIFDNIDQHLYEALSKTIRNSKRVDFCTGYFNLWGWNEISDDVDLLKGEEIVEKEERVHRICRLLIGMHTAPMDEIKNLFREDVPLDHGTATRLKDRVLEDLRKQLYNGIPDNRYERYLRKLASQLRSKKVVVKIYLKRLHAKLYLAYKEDEDHPEVGYVGSSNLTLAGLSKQGELNVRVTDQSSAEKLSEWFDKRWEDDLNFDITEELAEIIENSWAREEPYSPYHVYIKMAYHLSREAREGVSSYCLPIIFEKRLFEFQKKAVLIAMQYIQKRGGVMIGDVVGLGKTFTTAAILKIFEEDFGQKGLIICPKNLESMWKGYIHEYDLRSIVVPLSMVHKKLKDGKRYDIVVIDESHNLRNSDSIRYKAIKEYIERYDSKVILLTATPYNKTCTDMSNQLKLFIYENADIGIGPERYIRRIGPEMFDHLHPDTHRRSIKAFERSDDPEDWMDLMKMFLIRRTRGFVEEHYAKRDKDGRTYLLSYDGKKKYLPKRIPRRIEYSFDNRDDDDDYAKLYSENVVSTINGLELPRYGLGNYIRPKDYHLLTPELRETIDNLSHAGKGLIGFCRTGLFKRLESSGYAFLLSLTRHILRNYVFIYAINNNLPIPVGENIVEEMGSVVDDDDDFGDEVGSIDFISSNEEFLDQAERLYKVFNTKYNDKFKWLESSIFDDDLLQHLTADCTTLQEILSMVGEWNPATDRRLGSLYTLITQKHPNDKVLIFTQFADTADYLEKQLKKMGVKKLAAVTGNTDNPVIFAQRFSPKSNNVTVAEKDELRVLIATDVLSEGQNLQDGHIVVNYDLPWAIIGLIQRAGRVDRLGQEAPEILCYSCIPAPGIENIINLRRRLTERITENAVIVGSDEMFFEENQVVIRTIYGEAPGTLDDVVDSDVDPSSYALQIWMDAIENDPKLKKVIEELPDVMYATKSKQDVPPIINATNEKFGVISYIRTSSENDILMWLDEDGKDVTRSQMNILKAAECGPNVAPLIHIERHHELVWKAVKKLMEENFNQSKSLGKRSSAKHKAYNRMLSYASTLSEKSDEYKAVGLVMGDLMSHPIKNAAKETINRRIRIGISDSELAELLTNLRFENKLSVIDNVDHVGEEIPKIICSMGLK